MTTPQPQERTHRGKFVDCIHRKDWDDLFMHGGCGLWAVMLHEKLGLPMVYFSPPELDVHNHVVVLRGNLCLDYEGPKQMATVANHYAMWSDVPPRPTNPADVRTRLAAKDCGDLIDPVLEFARMLYPEREHLYK